MKRFGALLLSLVCGLPSMGWALLGDNEAEAAVHYGAPISRSRDGGTRVYTHQGYRIIVTFENGRSSSEGFFKVGGSSSLSDETIRHLLQMHAAGKPWQELTNPRKTRIWVRSGAIATYGEEEGKAQFAVAAYAGSPEELIRANANQALGTPAG